MGKIKHFIEQSWLLIVSAFFFGLLIAVTNAAWSPRIEQNKKAKLNNLMQGLISKAQSFEVAAKDVEIPTKKGKFAKTNIYKAIDSSGRCAGFAFIAVGSGFADKIELVIAVDRRCENLFGFDVLSSNETPGFGDKIKEDYYRNQFAGAPAAEVSLVKTGDDGLIDNEIVAISGATVSSEAVVEIFNKYIDSVKQKLRQKGLIGDDR